MDQFINLFLLRTNLFDLKIHNNPLGVYSTKNIGSGEKAFAHFF